MKDIIIDTDLEGNPVNLDDLCPNRADPLLGWIDKKTGKNYRLKLIDGEFLSSPMIKEQIIQIICWPVKEKPGET